MEFASPSPTSNRTQQAMPPLAPHFPYRRLGICSAALIAGFANAQQDPFSMHVRPTDALTPAEELAALHVPDGFEIGLFASEPMIDKPMNMAFDEKGRLWVTSTVEYPYPVKGDRLGRDSIKVLEDTDGDGAADSVSTFVDGLNIPTGLLPYGSGVIAWSIPNIWFFDDTDGDGKCDERSVLYGPLGWERDTHGMNSSFRMGADGWVYATHGFNNETVVAGADGHEVTMHSGHVYRFRPDGSRIEIFTHGQVNPFGLAFDSRGYLYSADCHSWPITQLIKGAYYPSFGKPHDGLGFAPRMIEHTHNSTGLCGIVYLEEPGWPDGYDDNILIGDVLNCRVRRNQIAFTGTTPEAQLRDDFVISDDPWFRPVDLQLGPDGALYIADFYNKIIGHYEVPLDHPGRDRERGRIWRVAPQGGDGGQVEPSRQADRIRSLRSFAEPGLAREHPAPPRAELIAALADDNPHFVRAAARSLAQRPGADAPAPLARAIARCPEGDTHLRHALRIALRDNLAAPGAFTALAGQDLPASELEMIAAFAADSGSAPGAKLVLAALQTNEIPIARARDWLPKIAPRLPVEALGDVEELVRKQLPTSPLWESDLLLALPGDGAAAVREWAAEVGGALIEGGGEDAWQPVPHPAGSSDRSPWFRQRRMSADGEEGDFLCSLPEGGRPGESLTGVMRSPTFDLPRELTFFLAGHDGYPDRPAGGNNAIRLLDAGSGAELARAAPPRNDTAQAVTWDLSAHAGRRGYLEVIDGDTGDAYAWLAAGRFEGVPLPIPDLSPGAPQHSSRAAAAQLAARYDLRELAPALHGAIAAPDTPAQARSKLAQTLAKFSGDPVLAAAAPLLSAPGLSAAMR